MSLGDFLVRELRMQKAKEKKEKEEAAALKKSQRLAEKEAKEAAQRFREDNMNLIVSQFKSVLETELSDYPVKVYINKTQNNVECEDGDKFFLTAAKKHSDIRTEFRVKRRIDSSDFMRIFQEQMGSLMGATVTKDGKTHYTVQFMTPQEEVPSTIKRILTRVKPRMEAVCQA